MEGENIIFFALIVWKKNNEKPENSMFLSIFLSFLAVLSMWNSSGRCLVQIQVFFILGFLVNATFLSLSKSTLHWYSFIEWTTLTCFIKLLFILNSLSQISHLYIIVFLLVGICFCLVIGISIILQFTLIIHEMSIILL